MTCHRWPTTRAVINLFTSESWVDLKVFNKSKAQIFKNFIEFSLLLTTSAFTYLSIPLAKGSSGSVDTGLALCCVVCCYFFFSCWISWLAVRLVALTADDSDCVGVRKWMCPWLYWNGLRRLTAFLVHGFVGWKWALPIFTWAAFFFAERLSMIASKTYFLSLPSSYILLQLLFVMSQALLGGAYRAIISMHC